MTQNQYTMEVLAGITGATLIGPGELAIDQLLTDSRRLIFPAETLFFALKTSSNNGHRYVADLYSSGVRAFVVQQSFITDPYPEAAFLKVPDVLRALQAIAAAHRAHFKYPVVGITGSNGKTVVKEWLYQLLFRSKRVVRSPRSYNSQIGVPLSLWQMAGTHDLALIEAGISEPGEMEKLEAMIKPDVGIFTNIGHAHDQGFTSIEQKATEKAKLFAHAGKVVYCADYPLIDKVLKKALNGDENRLLAWSFTMRSDALFVSRNGKNVVLHLEEEPCVFTLPFADDGSVENCINALITAWHLGIPIKTLQETVTQLNPVEMRLQERRGSQGNLLINDFYNSDPESVRIALDLLRQQPEGRERIVVISEFEGLAEQEKATQYRHLISVLNSMPITVVVCIGGEWLNYVAGLVHEKHLYLSTEEFLAALPRLAWKNAAILLKGARKFQFEKIAERLQEQVHQTWLEVNLSNMGHNLRYYRSLIEPQTKVMAMVKALSYGAGTVEIARWLEFNRVDYLAVAYIDEGVTLRKGGISAPILVMNPDETAFDRMIEYRLEPELYSLRIVEQFIDAVDKTHTSAEPYPVHLKVETGMNRLGLVEQELNDALAMIANSALVSVKSVFSHLAASDEPALDDFTNQQISTFNTLAAKTETTLGYTVIKHLANTSGVARFPQAQLDMVRLGIGLYGAANSKKEQSQLKVVTHWFTRVSQIKQIKAGESVGYSRSFVADKPTTIATLPVGYADGFFRLLGNGKGKVFVKGEEATVIGRVCMDMIMVDVTKIPVQTGDVVEILGEHISVMEMATAAQTIPYEIFTHISSRVPRVYISE